MNIDIRKSQPSTLPTDIKGFDIDSVDSYTYLGVVLDNKLGFESHVEATSKKVQLRVSFNLLYYCVVWKPKCVMPSFWTFITSRSLGGLTL